METENTNARTAEDFLSGKLRRLEEYVPNTAVYRIRLDANESPFDAPRWLRDKFADALMPASFNRYPDPYASAPVGAYSKIIGVKAENIAMGNGSDELISIICNSFLEQGDAVVTLWPDFSMYEFYSSLAGAKIERVDKPEGWKTDFDEVARRVAETKAKVLIFSNPCNPTSKLYDRETVLELVGRCAELGCLCVVDEAYMDFAEGGQSLLTQETIDGNPNLIVLKTLSKLGLAALRAGFAVADRTLIKGILKVKSPYNVNTLTQAFTAAALSEYPYFSQRMAEIRGRNLGIYRVLASLADAGGYRTIKPDTNFVSLWYATPDAAKSVLQALRLRGISVRYTCGIIRVTCGSEEESTEFVREFEKLI